MIRNLLLRQSNLILITLIILIIRMFAYSINLIHFREFISRLIQTYEQFDNCPSDFPAKLNSLFISMFGFTNFVKN